MARLFCRLRLSRGRTTRRPWWAACRKNISPRTCSRRTKTSITACRSGRSKTRRVPTPRRKAWRTPASRHSSETPDALASLVSPSGVVAPPGISRNRSSQPRRAQRRDPLAFFLRRASQFLFVVLSGHFVVQRAWIAGARGLFLRLLARRDFCADLRVLGCRSPLRSRRHVSRGGLGSLISHRDGLGKFDWPFHLDCAAFVSNGNWPRFFRRSLPLDFHGGLPRLSAGDQFSLGIARVSRRGKPRARATQHNYGHLWGIVSRSRI